MQRRLFRPSSSWVAYFRANAAFAAAGEKPVALAEMPPGVRAVIAGSLPAWQLGETSDGRHLRMAARQYAEAQADPEFLDAVELFIREEQRHGAALGEWLDAVGIPRKSRDAGDSLFRCCRYAIPNYAVWASVVVMVESMAELYYAAVRRLSPCPRLQAECGRILRDEVRHIQFQCEHLAAARRRMPRWLRMGVRLAEAGFYAMVCVAVWLAHGRLLRASGMPARHFARSAAEKYRAMQRLMAPEGYYFGRDARLAAGSEHPQARRISLGYVAGSFARERTP